MKKALLVLASLVISCASPTLRPVPEARKAKRRDPVTTVWRRCLVPKKEAKGAQLGGVDIDSEKGLVVATLSAGRVAALDLRTGTVRWDTDVKGGFWAPPRIHGNVVLTASADGTFTVLDIRTGAVLWTRQLGAPVSSPIIVTGQVAYVTGDDDVVYAVPVSDGSQGIIQYRTMSIPPASRRTMGHSIPLVSQGRIYFGTEAGYLVAFDLHDPNEALWVRRIGPDDSERPSHYPISDVDVSPIRVGEFLYVASQDGGLAVVDADTGVMERRLEIQGISAWVSDGSMVYVYSPVDGMRAMVLTDLHEAWHVPLDAGAVRSMAVLGRGLYLLSAEHGLVALDRRTGRQWNVYGSGKGASGTLDVDGNLMSFIDDDGCVLLMESTYSR